MSPHEQTAMLVKLARRVIKDGARLSVWGMGDHLRDREFTKLSRRRVILYKGKPKAGIRPEVGFVLCTRRVKGPCSNKNGSTAVIYGPHVGVEMAKEVVLKSCEGLPPLRRKRKFVPNRDVLRFCAILSKKKEADKDEAIKRKVELVKSLIAEKPQVLKQKAEIEKKLDRILAAEKVLAELEAF